MGSDDPSPEFLPQVTCPCGAVMIRYDTKDPEILFYCSVCAAGVQIPLTDFVGVTSPIEHFRVSQAAVNKWMGPIAMASKLMDAKPRPIDSVDGWRYVKKGEDTP